MLLFVLLWLEETDPPDGGDGDDDELIVSFLGVGIVPLPGVCSGDGGSCGCCCCTLPELCC